MKPDLYGIAEIIRSLTPLFFASAGLAIILAAVVNSEKLAGDRFIYVLASAGPLLGFAGGGFSPQNRSPQNRVDHADRIDIDQSK
ncbi:hypothetical protein QUA70_12315 [Microcoleus sp. LAD1_D5]|uniref:hypothetical protein n=1 Tax=unclassified Microcoleus TaxID=2642155 RepID=UPI002FD210F0